MLCTLCRLYSFQPAPVVQSGEPEMLFFLQLSAVLPGPKWYSSLVRIGKNDLDGAPVEVYQHLTRQKDLLSLVKKQKKWMLVSLGNI